jgi:hypothetical protein
LYVRKAAPILIALALAGTLAGPAAGVRRQPHVRPKAAISPVRWALRAINFVETRAGGVLGHAQGTCVHAQTTQRPDDWQKVAAETRTLRDYLLAAEPSRESLVVQTRAAARLLRPFVAGSRAAHLRRAKALLLRAAADHAASFEALGDGADALDAHDCASAKTAWTSSGEQSVAGQDEARRGLIELRAAGFRFVDPDWAYE